MEVRVLGAPHGERTIPIHKDGNHPPQVFLTGIGGNHQEVSLWMMTNSDAIC
jgi:hypothetical protein